MKPKGKEKPSTKDQVAGIIAFMIVRAQLRLSKGLKSWERRQNPKRLKLLFFIFIISGFGYCAYLLLDALIRKDSPAIPANSSPVESKDSTVKGTRPLYMPLPLPDHNQRK